ncbi:hypothetical protein AMAG_03769 [Allomyces macrogynus ATCC 38327]|uniref:Mpv17/PMP22 family protein n=1 Tax=Allomyces macrogynus (strain ATCC 38327) TaxID=578462 RepID=A0A0L0SAT4_ALLM3|nr:hypothetical protein AMAG_03769 [Allomyces macrogynus ATCC 38327]|eukprot:KNE59495.1 hypothetical protein AMAG_03769 [Allomyces macrogynus ATCC 38327]
MLRSPTANILVKGSLTAGALFTVGDVVAQRVVAVPQNADQAAAASISMSEFFRSTYDPHRTARMALTGLLLNGPYFTAAFAAMDRLYPARLATSASSTGPAWRAPLTRALQKAVTTHLLAFPPYLVLFVTFTTAVEYLQSTRFGAPIPPDRETDLGDRVVARVEAKVKPMFLTGSMLWPWVNTLNFWLFTGTARIVVMNMVGLGWNTYLSWYLAKHPVGVVEKREVEEVMNKSKPVMVEAGEL